MLDASCDGLAVLSFGARTSILPMSFILLFMLGLVNISSAWLWLGRVNVCYSFLG